MFKQILGITVIICLFGIVIFNFIEKRTEEKTDDVTGISSDQGVGLVPPGMAGFDVGEIAPDFELETFTGEKVKLSDFKGKKIFLNFWASWCKPCKQEMPDMQKFYEKYKDEVEIVAINLTGKENNETNAKQFVEENGFTYPILLDPKLTVGKTYSAVAIPTTYFIGSDMTFQAPRKTGPMTYDEMVEVMKKLK